MIFRCVPKRPKYSRDHGCPDVEIGPEESDEYCHVVDPHFYTASRKAPNRHFVINPEWFSEKIKFDKTAKAYQSCTLKYGWC